MQTAIRLTHVSLSKVIIAFAVLVLIMCTRASGSCGDPNGNGASNISDISYSLSFLMGGATPVDPDSGDADGYNPITIRDVAVMVNYIFSGGPAPVCPTSPYYTPTYQPLLNITCDSVFPADVDTVTLAVRLESNLPNGIYAMTIPIQFEVDGEIPIVQATTAYSGNPGQWPQPSGVFAAGGGPNYPVNTLLLSCYSFSANISAGSYLIGSLRLQKTAAAISRKITFKWAELAPILKDYACNYVMIVDQNMNGWEPTLNGIRIDQGVNFFVTPRKVLLHRPVFLRAQSSDSFSSITWKYDSEDSETVTSRDWSYVFQTTGPKSISMRANMAGGGAQIVKKPLIVNVVTAKADFSASQRAGVKPFTVNFQDLSAGTPTAWFWRFGDNATSSLRNPTHIYNNSGDFTVTLTVTGTMADTDTRSVMKYIKVRNTPFPDLQNELFSLALPKPGFVFEISGLVFNHGSASSTPSTLTFDVRPLLPYCTIEFVIMHTGWDSAGGVFTVPIHNLVPTPENKTSSLHPAYQDSTYVDGGTIKFRVKPGTLPGTVLAVSSHVNSISGELNLANNSSKFHSTVVAASDPNNKRVAQPGCGPSRAVLPAQKLDYIINFENKSTATAPATFIYVVDTLDPKLDWSSFELRESSKDSVLDFTLDTLTGEAIWFFNGINLPPNITPPEGEGYCQYSILPKATVTDGDSISNRAHIIFDYQPWIDAPEAGPVVMAISTADSDADGILDACDYNCGDPNGDHTTNISDAVFLIAYIFAGGPAPNPLLSGDCDCAGIVNISDAVYLVAYIFAGGQAPCAACK